MAKLLPPVCDAAGIDAVFSGHDHSYGRTAPLYVGKPSPQGTVYVVGGTTGPKFYPAAKNQWFEACSGKQERLFLDCEVNSGRLTVTAVNEDTVITDRFSIAKRENI